MSYLSRRPSGNVPCLDALGQFLAAILLVFSGHLGEFFDASFGIQKLPFIYFGWSGVDLFFVLSGYLIGGQLWKELNRTGSVDVGRFILRRGFRIWPFYFGFILCSMIYATTRGRSLNGFQVDICCVSNYFRNRVSGGWSLSTEEQFYILLPAVLVGSRLLSSCKLIVVPIVWTMTLPLLRWLVTRNAPQSEIATLIYRPFHTHSDGLAIGLMVAWIAIICPSTMKGGWRSGPRS